MVISNAIPTFFFALWYYSGWNIVPEKLFDEIFQFSHRERCVPPTRWERVRL